MRVYVRFFYYSSFKQLVHVFKSYSRTYAFQVTSERQANYAFSQIYRSYGRLDVLVNCAGIGPLQQVYNSVTDNVHSLQLFQTVLRVNLIGTFNMSRLAAQLMARNKKDSNGLKGLIVNAASVAAYDSPIGFVCILLPYIRLYKLSSYCNFKSIECFRNNYMYHSNKYATFDHITGIF